MTRRNGGSSRRAARLVLVALVVGSFGGTASAGQWMTDGPREASGQETTTDGGRPGVDGTLIRVVHASPDAPPVDLYIDGERVRRNVSFGTTTGYVRIPPGDHPVLVTAAGDRNRVLYDRLLPVREGIRTSIVLTGEVGPGGTRFETLVFMNRTVPTGGPNASVRFVHASPDAPPLDVTVNETGRVLFDDISFRDVSDYARLPPGTDALDVRVATENDRGRVIRTVDVSVERGIAYTAFALGYVTPGDEPTDARFDVLVVDEPQREAKPTVRTTPQREVEPTARTTPDARRSRP